MLKFLMLNSLQCVCVFMCMCSFKVNILKCSTLMFKNAYFTIFWWHLIPKLFTFLFRPFFQGRMSAVELEDSTKVRGSEFMTQRACSVTLESMLTSFPYHLLFLLRLDPSVYFPINIYYSNILARIKACRFCL